MENKQLSLSELWPVMKEQIEIGKTVVFSPSGTSMLPLIHPDTDKVKLTKAPERLKKYDLPLYLREDGQFVLHRVVALTRGGYTMCGDNQFKREYGVKNEQILALACGVYRDGRFLSFDDKNYLSYCKRQVRKKRFYGFYIKLRRFFGRIKRRIINRQG